jgi:octaprenyl-diphosphate synthase
MSSPKSSSENAAYSSQQGSAAERFAQALALIPELATVEQIIRKSFCSDVAPMRDIPEYLLSLGGKRIRPALTLLTAKALGASAISQDILDVSAGIELIHMATLMHDDIIDQSPIRRHKPSPYATFGVPLTLLSGDFLLTRAFGLCAKLDDTVIAATEQACIELVEGEALETALHTHNHSRASSVTIAQRKTASLFRLATFCAGHLTHAPLETVQSLSQFGESMGIAFQIIDDILDVISTEAVLGKQPGLDLIERKPSIVNVLWLESGDSAAAPLRHAPNARTDPEFVRAALDYLPTSAVMRSAKALAFEYGERARQGLEQALSLRADGSTHAADALHAVLDFALDRLS